MNTQAATLTTCPCPYCTRTRQRVAQAGAEAASIIAGMTITDLGIRVEEAPEAPAPATDVPQTVTLEQIEAKIVREDYIQELNGGTLTICVLTLANGFDVVGTSGCADPAKYDAELGRKYAREDAIRQVWPLEGYLLRERMWRVNYPAQTEDAGKPCDMNHLGIDGAKWAAEFKKTAVGMGHLHLDEQWLDGWFCNAIKAGFDEARRRYEQPVHAAECATQGAAAPALDPEWRRVRAMELALGRLPDGWAISCGIEDARAIEAYLSGEDAQPQPAPQAEPLWMPNHGRWLAKGTLYADYQQAKAVAQGGAA